MKEMWIRQVVSGDEKSGWIWNYVLEVDLTSNFFDWM